MSGTTTSDRLRKVLRQLECAREETADQSLRTRLGELTAEVSVLLLDVEDGYLAAHDEHDDRDADRRENDPEPRGTRP